MEQTVRTPTRVESNARVNLTVFPLPNRTPTQVSLFGNPNLDSESVLAYELGYRFEPTRKLSFDVAAFYNDYDLISSRQEANQFETKPNPHLLFNPYRYENGFMTNSYRTKLLTH